ncbi:MAG: site-specific integrase [Opitutaceae bacterium]|nr:site-specific integrase [Opitutaceae bacterium]
MKVEATKVTNLVRSQESGVYYARAKIRGKLLWRSLETETFSIAKLRLPYTLKKLQEAVPAEIKMSPKLTFGEAAELYKKAVNEHPRLKPAAKQFRLRSELTLRRTWSDVFSMELRRITPEACKTWLARFENGASRFKPPQAKNYVRPGNSPTTVNAAIAFLKHVFAIGLRGGILYRNPALELQRKKPNRKLLRLPNKTQFAEMVALIRATPFWGFKVGDFVEGLAYSGMRVGEARRLTWGHIDLEKGTMAIPGEKTDSAPRVVPLTPKMAMLLVRMKTEPERSTTYESPVFEVGEATASLTGACAKVGAPRMTHHDLRHMFATTCIESGVDVPTVSRWLGHADGGALAMRTYGHLRPEHSIEAAKKVRFD